MLVRHGPVHEAVQDDQVRFASARFRFFCRLPRPNAHADISRVFVPILHCRYHKGAVNGVAFHRSYPLFCSASSDGAVHAFHATVYTDLLQNPLVASVKVLPAHASGVLDCAFHPSQPWVFTAGNDNLLKLFQ